MNKKIKMLGLLFLLTAVCFTGCGGKNEKETSAKAKEEGYNLVEIRKDGSIKSTIVEPFPESYCDEDELKRFILQEAADYNGETGENSVSVKKFSVKKEMVTVSMEYGTSQDFGGFNAYPFFSGTVAEAYEEGYDFSGVVFLEADAASKKETAEEIPSIQKEQLLEMGNRRIVIASLPEEETLTLKTSGKILYISGASCEKKNQALIKGSKGGTETAYIVFK